MSLKPQGVGPIPETTDRVAHTAFPKGNAIMRLRDALGPIYTDEQFRTLFPQDGQPALARFPACTHHHYAIRREIT